MTSNHNYEVISEAYRKWLINEFINKGKRADIYTKLLYALFHEEYYYLIPNDMNRGEDGKNLRNRFIESRRGQRLAARKTINENDIVESMEMLGKPNMLEVMISICLYMEDMTRSFVPDNSATYWMGRLIDNLNLANLTNDVYDRLNGDIAVRDAVEKVLSRTYDKLGRGSLFPMRDSKRNRHRDYRDIEIWYQMQTWLGENVNYSRMDYAKFDAY